MTTHVDFCWKVWEHRIVPFFLFEIEKLSCGKLWEFLLGTCRKQFYGFPHNFLTEPLCLNGESAILLHFFCLTQSTVLSKWPTLATAAFATHMRKWKMASNKSKYNQPTKFHNQVMRDLVQLLFPWCGNPWKRLTTHQHVTHSSGSLLCVITLCNRATVL